MTDHAQAYINHHLGTDLRLDPDMAIGIGETIDDAANDAIALLRGEG